MQKSSLTHTHHKHPLSLSLSLIHTHTHTHTHTHAVTYTYTHTHTHTPCYNPPPETWTWWPQHPDLVRTSSTVDWHHSSEGVACMFLWKSSKKCHARLPWIFVFPFFCIPFVLLHKPWSLFSFAFTTYTTTLLSDEQFPLNLRTLPPSPPPFLPNVVSWQKLTSKTSPYFPSSLDHTSFQVSPPPPPPPSI